MTILIAHRGLIFGPDTEIENHPQQILQARNAGYDVEIDVWFVNNRWVLGHDGPVHEIDMKWLYNVNCGRVVSDNHAWIHAKNIDALYELQRLQWQGHLFYHQNDDAVLTNTGYLWTYPGKQLTPLSICVMPEWTDNLLRCNELTVHGFCSDYIDHLSSLLKTV